MRIKNASLTFALAGATFLFNGTALGADGQTTAPAPSPSTLPALNTTRLSWDLVGLAKLVQSRVDDQVILTYIQNTPPKKKPTADELVYLHELGLSSDAMVALMNAAPVSLPEPITAPRSEPAASTTVQSPPAVTQAPAQSPAVSGDTVISAPAPAPTVVYTRPAPVYVQQPVVTYVEPVRPRITFGFSFGHFFGHHGHWGHHHHGGHHRRHH